MSLSLFKRLGVVLVTLVACEGSSSPARVDAVRATDAAEAEGERADSESDAPPGYGSVMLRHAHGTWFVATRH
jgi:hypothetical protein